MFGQCNLQQQEKRLYTDFFNLMEIEAKVSMLGNGIPQYQGFRVSKLEVVEYIYLEPFCILIPSQQSKLVHGWIKYYESNTAKSSLSSKF